MGHTAQTIAEPSFEGFTTTSTVAELAARLQAARGRTLLLTSDLDEQQLMGPRLAIVNPPLWEIAHVGWFQEHWCLRYRAPGELAPSLIADADALYNSAIAAHDSRWELPLLPHRSVLRYLAQVLQQVLEKLAQQPADGWLRYCAELAACHEEMHCEAFTYTRQTLGYPAPQIFAPVSAANGPWPGDVSIPGGEYLLGALPGQGFVFDNEKWAHRVRIEPFKIARAAVSKGEYAAFVDAGGYENSRWWSAEGWQWRCAAEAHGPVYWRKEGSAWLERSFDSWAEFAPHAAMIHVNWHEAQAWCRWAGRRLPSEAEWEQAAATDRDDPAGMRTKRRYPWGDAPPDAARALLHGATDRVCDVACAPQGDSAWGCRQMMGNVWEWTTDWFKPYPGFVRDPYEAYSEPWFGNHKVLRGGCYATSPALMRNTWRNFYTPDRRDVCAGFRTCALS